MDIHGILIPFQLLIPPSFPWFFVRRSTGRLFGAVVNEQGRHLDVGISDSNALALVARQVSQKDEAEATAVNIWNIYP